MCENSAASLTLLSVVRQWPVASNIAQHLPAGSLINLTRSSTSLRGILHGFDMSTTLETHITNDPGTCMPSEDVFRDVRSCKVLYIGAHRTPYWQGLKRLAPFTCSSKTHTKGDKTRSCRYCSMPICESCVVKHSFGKNENTFKNRCRFMCQRCWDTGNVQKEQRYSGKFSAADEYCHKSAAEAREFCTCTSKDGWVCNDCKEKQNTGARVDGPKVCFGRNCGVILEEDKDRRKICLWCDRPVPRGRASMESRIAFNQKMIDARGREISSQLADFEEYESNRRRQMFMSRREMRGNEAVENDPEADVQQFLRNLDVLNYQRLIFHPHRPWGAQPTGDEVYASKQGRWIYNSDFLKCFMRKCWRHKNAAHLRSVTSSDSPNAPPSKTNMELMGSRRILDGRVQIGQLAAASNSGFDSTLDRMKDPPLTQEQMPDAEASPHHLEGVIDSEREQEADDETAEVRREGEPQTRHDESGPGPGPAELQPGERPPEYGADTLILETGDSMDSD